MPIRNSGCFVTPEEGMIVESNCLKYDNAIKHGMD